MSAVDINSATLNRLNNFVDTHNLLYPNCQLGTTEDAIDFLIQSVEFYQTMVTEEDVMIFLRKLGIEGKGF